MLAASIDLQVRKVLLPCYFPNHISRNVHTVFTLLPIRLCQSGSLYLLVEMSLIQPVFYTDYKKGHLQAACQSASLILQQYNYLYPKILNRRYSSHTLCNSGLKRKPNSVFPSPTHIYSWYTEIYRTTWQNWHCLDIRVCSAYTNGSWDLAFLRLYCTTSNAGGRGERGMYSHKYEIDYAHKTLAD